MTIKPTIITPIAWKTKLLCESICLILFVQIIDYQAPCDEAKGYIPVQDKSSYSNLQQLHKFVPQGHHLPL